ncbi:Uncharacterized protein DAT39_005670 [Clarias magur]|uniref:Uncharacterized protein n=1 Tax=Clarias magur TaxID=1594786 RepID=A0A8J4ULS1_CLAMG|nr:Uncharacterized protein DAT39_005670 [Clarias magur]
MPRALSYHAEDVSHSTGTWGRRVVLQDILQKTSRKTNPYQIKVVYVCLSVNCVTLMLRLAMESR